MAETGTARATLRPGGLGLTRRLVEPAGLAPGAKLLDVGCGAGASVELLRREYGLAALGVDQNPPPPAGAEAGVLLEADAHRLPFADDMFEAVLFECSLSKMDKPALALAEAARVLKPGGLLLLADLYAKGAPGSFGPGLLGRLDSRAHICNLAAAPGFELLHFQDCPGAAASWWGAQVFSRGEAGLGRLLGAGPEALKKAKCSYFLSRFRLGGQAEWQLKAAAGQLARAIKASGWWRRQLAGAEAPEQPTAGWLQSLPFTSPQALAAAGAKALCVPLDGVERIRSQASSGTTGPAKRVWFTGEDLERTVDFFALGMRPLAGPGQTVAVMLSDAKPGGIGDLLRRGLARYGARAVICGQVRSAGPAARAAAGAHCLVGLPAEMLYLCRKAPGLRPQTVLLSADYVPAPVVQALEAEWGCRVFTHYGLTETGYGLAVQCAERRGQHLRADDFLVEIVDPATGQPLPPGQPGEVVLTSLRPRALPLVRYRTGDIASLVDGPCPCGSSLPRLGPVLGRAANLACEVNIHRLDETLFVLPGLCAYAAAWQPAQRRLHLELETLGDLKYDVEMLKNAMPWSDIRLELSYGKAESFTEAGKRRLKLIKACEEDG